MMKHRLTGGTYLQFMAEVWQPPAQSNRTTNSMKVRDNINLKNVGMSDGKTKVVVSGEFPFLDTAMPWKNNCLRCGVYCKPKQALKYVDTSSTYRPTVFKSITNRVFTRLTRLTSNSTETKNESFEKVYPKHAKTLKKLALYQANFLPYKNSTGRKKRRKTLKKKKLQKHVGTIELFVL
eukprot:15365774-Ditylum_brightwellii.AAC.1